MEILIATFSWIVSILLGLLVLSVPTDLIISKVKKDWKDSKGQGIYKKVQLISMGVWLVLLMITIVLMTGTF